MMKPKPPPMENFEFPARYSDDPAKRWTSGSWEEYTDAARSLYIVKSDDGFYSLQKSKFSDPFTLCHEDLVSSEFRLFRRSNTETKEGVIPYSKITMTDCKNFRYLLFEAERNLKVFERYLTPHSKKAVVLQHDSTVEDVVERLPVGFIHNAQGPMFRTLLQELISMAKKEHQEKSYHDYTLFLMNYWDRIKTDTTAAECLEMLKDDPDFVTDKFGDLESHRLERGMQTYLKYRKALGGKMFSYMYIRQMDADYQYKRDVMWKARNRLPVELMSPIHFLAFKKRHEEVKKKGSFYYMMRRKCSFSYHIQSLKEGYRLQHPVKEIMKFRAYFGLFFNGVPPSLCAELWCSDPTETGSLLERQTK